MKTTFKIKGKILFDPPNLTAKHQKQSSWKKVAYVSFKGDLAKYYQWFVRKRYNLYLSNPIRGPHITFINDSLRDIGSGINNWEKVKKKWNNKTIEVILSVDIRTDGETWWLNVPEEERKLLHDIRKEVGLGRPYFGLHMTVGTVVDSYSKEIYHNNIPKAKIMNVEHSRYIHNLIKKGLIN